MRDVVKYTYINEDLDSSALECIWYDVFSKRLYVEFHNGRVAGYLNVPVSVVEALEGSTSTGAYYTKNVKDVYHGTSGDVDLQPFDDTSDMNLYPAFVPFGDSKVEEPEVAESEIVNGTYVIEFTVTAKTEFNAPSGNLVEALSLFVGSFSEGNKDASVHVRSIAEVV